MDGIYLLVSAVVFLFKIFILVAIVAGVVLLIRSSINKSKIAKDTNATLHRIENELICLRNESQK